MSTEKFNYKKSLEEIEEIVNKLETEDVDVDELAEMVKKASQLIKKCKEKLKSTGDDLEKVIDELD